MPVSEAAERAETALRLISTVSHERLPIRVRLPVTAAQRLLDDRKSVSVALGEAVKRGTKGVRFPHHPFRYVACDIHVPPAMVGSLMKLHKEPGIAAGVVVATHLGVDIPPVSGRLMPLDEQVSRLRTKKAVAEDYPPGRELKSLRVQIGLSRQEVGERFGITANALSMMENENTRNAALRHRIKEWLLSEGATETDDDDFDEDEGTP